MHNISAVLAMPESPIVIAVDVPIGLATTAVRGGRTCETMARHLLAKRASCVFSSPTRAALSSFRAGGGYRTVSAANRGGVPHAPGLSLQTFAILPKIDEVDRVITPVLQGRVVEVHPELCFMGANAGAPMASSKRTVAGRQQRVAVLQQVGFPVPLQLLGTHMLAGAKGDDLLDACIACWTANRVASGVGIVVPTTPPTDSVGLRMELWR